MKRWLIGTVFLLMVFSKPFSGEVFAREFRQTGSVNIDYLNSDYSTPFYPETGYELIVTKKFRIRISKKDWDKDAVKRRAAMQKAKEKALSAARKAGADGIHFRGYDSTGGGLFTSDYSYGGTYMPGRGMTVSIKEKHYLIVDFIRYTGIIKKLPPKPPEPPWKPNGRLGRPIWPHGKIGGDFIPPLRFTALDGSEVVIKAGDERVGALFLYLYNSMTTDPYVHIDQLSILKDRFNREIEIMAVLTNFKGLRLAGWQVDRETEVVSRFKKFIPESRIGLDPGGEIIKALGWLPPGFGPIINEIAVVINSDGRILCSEFGRGERAEVPCAALGRILEGYWPHQKTIDDWRGVSRTNPQ